MTILDIALIAAAIFLGGFVGFTAFALYSAWDAKRKAKRDDQ